LNFFVFFQRLQADVGDEARAVTWGLFDGLCEFLLWNGDATDSTVFCAV
jgi:hypothetical protein